MMSMNLMALVNEFGNTAERISTPEELETILRQFTPRMGFHFFALTQHANLIGLHRRTFRLHNYPPGWETYFDSHSLGIVDPVHKASHMTSFGFPWRKIHLLMPLTGTDSRVLDLAPSYGIGEGYTVPANVPGERHGSISFAMPTGQALPEENLPAAQLIGGLAFEAARRIWRTRPRPTGRQVLSRAERECVLWAIRGKSAWETSVILDVTKHTVEKHLKNAQKRYGVRRKTLLVALVLRDGTANFEDLRGY
jgi:LuxR family quorum-sensing system transcriptional regulator CciR